MNHDPHDLVSNSRRVRVHSGALGSKHVMAEGKVVAYSEHPQICVEADDGIRSWWPVTLPIDVVQPLPPEPPVGSFVVAGSWPVWRRYADGWYRPDRSDPMDRTWAQLHEMYSEGGLTHLVPVDGPTARVIEAAKAWRAKITDSVRRGGAEPRVWADDEDLALIDAVDALAASSEPTSP